MVTKRGISFNEAIIRLSALLRTNASIKPAINKAKPTAHQTAPQLSSKTLTNMKNMERIRKINSGGLTSIIPNNNWLRLGVVSPLPINEKPNHEYLNQVFIQRARWFTNWSVRDVFSSNTTAPGAHAMR